LNPRPILRAQRQVCRPIYLEGKRTSSVNPPSIIVCFHVQRIKLKCGATNEAVIRKDSSRME